VKKRRKSLVLMEKKVMQACFKEKKRSNEVPRARKVSLKGQRECTVSHAQWHSCVKNPTVKPQSLIGILI